MFAFSWTTIRATRKATSFAALPNSRSETYARTRGALSLRDSMKPYPLYRSIAGCAERFRSSLPRAKAIQRARLRSILERNASSDYGSRYGFASLDSPDVYRERVPVVRYEDLREFIRRVEKGEPNVLFSEPLLAFEETGGSTSGPKLIPYTAGLLEAFRRALIAWLDDLARAHPSISRGRAYWSISPAGRRPRAAAGGVPVGLSSDAAYFGEALAPLVRETLAVPPEAGALEDLALWRETTRRHLAACHDLALISVWSPTFLFDFLESADLCAKPVAVISCWDQAASRPYADTLRERFPRARVQGKGLLATEGVVTIPLEGLPMPVLAIDSGYFEFRDDAGHCLEASDVAVGREYEVLMTTEGGLYRYAIGDRVRVYGFAGEAPTLEFLGRGETASDLCGEKLTEAFVLSALAPLGLRFMLLAPTDLPRPGYALYLDAEEASAEDSPRIAKLADRALERNPQYAQARRLGQLAPVAVSRCVRPLAAWTRAQLQRARRLGDIKPPVLSPDSRWAQDFESA